jgi:hypothetical protein
MNHPVVHFEIPAADPARLRQFYAGLFGWEFEEMAGMGGYVAVKTTPEGGPGINGGMMKKQSPQHVPMRYVLVESVAEFAEKAKKLGGQVVVGKTPIPGMGHFAICLDPEGQPVGLFEMDASAARG